MPQVQQQVEPVGLGAGVDIATPELGAKPGTLRFAYNYEPDLDGGLTRVGGIERYDGHEEPDLARFSLLRLSQAPAGLVLGNTLSGQTSLATGVVIYIDDKLVAVTRVVGTFAEGEQVHKGGPALAVVADVSPAVTGELDNELAKLAAAEYRTSIAALPGGGPVRGIEILGETVYAWRDNQADTALITYKATPTGWQEVIMPYELPFSAGSSEYEEGESVTQGGVSAVVRRVVLESGSWSAGTAAGRLIVAQPSGGSFAPGAAAGGGACTLLGTAQQVRMLTASSTLYAVEFTGGSAEYSHGSALIQGSVSAIVRMVLRQSGSWAGTAAGILLVEAPVGGSFVAGATTGGGGACTIVGPQQQIELQALGVVRTDVANFSASLSTTAVYGCDGVNREFELRDDILVPLNTGSGWVRATAVRAHKSHLVLGYRGSISHSSIGSPYQWTAVLGAAELGTGDTVTDMVPVGGESTAAALMVLCRNSLFVLYGNSAADWNLVALSVGKSGAMAGTAQDAGGVVALDRPGVVRYPASQAFGNFAWDVLTRKLNAIAAGQRGIASVFVPERSLYRVWLADGTMLSGLVGPAGPGEWTVCNYGRNIKCAASREMGDRTRTFVGDGDGWVYETDVGRSFAGERILCAARLSTLMQRSPYVVKQYSGAELEIEARSASQLSIYAEFSEQDGQSDPTLPFEFIQPGGGLIWDVGKWDSAYWDVSARARRAFPLEGEGLGITVTIGSNADNELPHTLRALSIQYTPRRQVRLR